MKQAKLLSQPEMKRLAAIIDSRRYATRNHTAVALSFYAGLRACEIAALRIKDVFDDKGCVRDTVFLRSDQTKGSDSCTILINKRLAKQLQAFAGKYPGRISKPDGPVMFSAKGGGFNPQTIVNLFQNLYKAAGILTCSPICPRSKVSSVLVLALD